MTLADFLPTGNWIDIGCCVTGMIHVVVQRLRKERDYKPLSARTGRDFADGMTMFPLVIMTAGVAWPKLIGELVEASKPTLALAGIFAILAILEDAG